LNAGQSLEFADEGHGFPKKENNDLRREVETVFLKRLFGTGLLNQRQNQ